MKTIIFLLLFCTSVMAQNRNLIITDKYVENNNYVLVIDSNGKYSVPLSYYNEKNIGDIVGIRVKMFSGYVEEIDWGVSAGKIRYIGSIRKKEEETEYK